MIEVVGMIYKSPAYRDLLETQMYRQGWGIGGIRYRTVANDPDPKLRLTDDTDIYHDPKPNDYYLSRVYRCWNYCVESSIAEYVCLVNSDMVFSKGWLEALERRLDGKTLPVSRLVEPWLNGDRRFTPGKNALHFDLGRDPVKFPFDSWELMAKDLSEDRTEPGGLYMPCVLHRETFLRVGGYPQDNMIVKDGVAVPDDHTKGGTLIQRGGSWFTVDGYEYISADDWLFRRMAEEGFRHVTCFDSLVYHFQEGEMRHGS